VADWGDDVSVNADNGWWMNVLWYH